ncbi:MAG: SDR family oxidoreductase [Verrucomicrobiae bacterium]|nr:SDR family oxidoreductase [Verrucomicrobiae bacterium]
MKKEAKKENFPPQHQERQPGLESEMTPRPQSDDSRHRGSGKLQEKIALITGGDSGIGRAVAIAFAKEGAHVAINFLNETEDAKETKHLVEEYGGECLLLPGDMGYEEKCQALVKKIWDQWGKINILVNNSAEQHPQESIEDITSEQLMRTFQTNVFAMFYLTKVVIKKMSKGDTIINTTSVTAYRGSPGLLDYSSTKGAIVSFTRSLALSVVSKGIRVNAVAPGPIWTPLIPSTFPKEDVTTFGSQVPMKRAGQPEEVAPSYVFLASDDSSYITGQVLHPNGGEIVNT